MPRQNQRQVILSAMDKITQTELRRQAAIKYSQKFGVTRAAARYHMSRQSLYRWIKRYDGTLESLADRSHRPHSHPKQHRPEEIKLIENMRRRNPNAGLVVFWVKLRQRGYSRSISGLYRFLKKKGLRDSTLKDRPVPADPLLSFDYFRAEPRVRKHFRVFLSGFPAEPFLCSAGFTVHAAGASRISDTACSYLSTCAPKIGTPTISPFLFTK